MNADDIESARLQWAASLFNQYEIESEFKALISIDSLMKRNIDLVQRFKTGTPHSDLKYLDTQQDDCSFWVTLHDSVLLECQIKGSI